MSARITDPEQLKELLGIPFTPEQTACITAPPAPQVIVAGAGSGKTTVMAARVVWLVGTGQVAPEQVLGLTFTNKAAGELAERVRKALIAAGVTDPEVIDPDHPPGEPTISTYHAFAGRLLTEHGLRIGLEPSTRLLADATRYQLAAKVLREAPGPYPALTRSFPTLVSDLLALDGELSEHLVRPERLETYDTELLHELATARLTNADLRKVPETAEARRSLLALTERYRTAKRSRDLIDFGDQIALSAELALTRPEVGAILRDEFRVVLLDEYQDTSVAQRLLLSGLFGSGPGAGATGHAVTAVGDPCQAIYGWRGASVANLDDFPEHFPHADGTPATRYSLSENRRSGGRLLQLANGLAEPLRAMHEGVEALRPAPGAERDGTVRCALLNTHTEEIDWLADSLAHLVRTGTPPGEIAVLCRTAGDFPAIQAALVARDIPVEVVGLAGLLHLPEVADLVAVCEVLQDPGANASLVRLLTGPRWRIGPRDLALLGRRARLLVHRAAQGEDADPDRRLAEAVEGTDPAEVISLADALDTFLIAGDAADDGLPFSAEARVRFARLARELRDLRRSLADPLMDVLHRVLATTGLEVELSASPQALAARRRETLANFLDTAARFAALDGEASLLAFLGFLRTAAQYEKGLDNALPGGENTVKVLTAHKSKGLEWDVVAVPGLVTGQFPSGQSRDAWTAQAKVLPHALRGDAATLPDVDTFDAKGMKAFKEEMKAHQHTEELRLGYVTFTRPRSLLLGSGHWWGPSQKRTRGPSAFLEALYEHCAAGHGEIEVWADEPAEDEENPALAAPDTDRAWPLPLDPTALARRRAARDTVLAHLERLAVQGDEQPPAYAPGPDDVPAYGSGPEHAPAYEPWDDEPPLDEPPADEGGDWDALPTERPAGTPDPQDVSATDPDPASEPVRESAPTPPPEPVRESAAESVRESAPAPEPERQSAPAPTPEAPPHELPHPHIPAARHPQEEPADRLTPEEARTLASWDRDLDALAGELRRARATVHDVLVPASLSATQLLLLADDPDAFAKELARPMPRPPQPAARRGTRFHAWVESRYEELPLPMLGPDELPGGDESDAEIADERDLAELKEAFGRTAYARRTPYRVETPFQITLAGRVIRGRIDAVYRTGDTYEIVDWKTTHHRTADPLQLAVYRLAWAELHDLPLDAVTATFLYVRSGETVHPQGLPGRAELERILLDEPVPGDG
ncbi:MULTISPECIES: ATP-dependent DNA helicase [Streptomyces]|uniref:ATP-dependent DNA helicase n=1 Tax=Streptomyces TaxID=1883 RepID=UPI001038E97A|nr:MULTISPECIES: ATP-dependent DNA helicase [Streptomyces]MBT3075749.1 UvrD-helicase domain-containing protein [Streptomyces sp. COG21]MBT3079737.1 UvrD-helicase domain-containing protein [Streptomyces sp. COG20]MBT3089826.1 UvrD-helicase domain-containing protein [Streptomyces sp. CYG21]MBT3101139.1 UvrD-helicase domain-containing protein [Streptomyces sp. CBG30]MBT3106388.1 UvrD-helicase domain-containing protein [Streptomyces sp. COG19]